MCLFFISCAWTSRMLLIESCCASFSSFGWWTNCLSVSAAAPSPRPASPCRLPETENEKTRRCRDLNLEFIVFDSSRTVETKRWGFVFVLFVFTYSWVRPLGMLLPPVFQNCGCITRQLPCPSFSQYLLSHIFNSWLETLQNNITLYIVLELAYQVHPQSLKSYSYK